MTTQPVYPGRTAPDNRRRFPRTRVLLTGRLYRGEGAVDCVVTNLSAGGARIAAREPARIDPPVPDGTEPASLLIERYGIFPGELLWRDGRAAGLRFRDAPPVIAAAMWPTLSPERSGMPVVAA